MKKLGLFVCALGLCLLPSIGKAGDTTPSVSINGCMDWTDDNEIAILTPDDVETWPGEFYFFASLSDEPTARAECQLSGPTYDWQFVAPAEGAVISPHDEDSTTLTLYDEVNWGQSYSLSVTVTWQETGPVAAGPRGEIKATKTIQIAAMKVAIDDIGNICTKGPHSCHQVYVEVGPDDLGLPVTLELSGTGSGFATFQENDDTELTITESHWVTIEGWQSSDALNDMTLTASFGSGSGVTKTFTIYDVEQLAIREQLHENNAASSGTKDDGTVLDICQEGDGGARLLFNLDFWPWEADGSKFLWDLVWADDEAADDWCAQSGDFGEGEGNVTWNPDDPPATREFYLRAWFDCEETGQFDATAPYRKIKVHVVDLKELTLKDAQGNQSVSDSTRENEKQADNNTLLLSEAADGQTKMTIDLSWSPSSVNGKKFLYRILRASDNAPSTQWSPASGEFEKKPIIVTWKNKVGDETERSFVVDAWFDCNGNGQMDEDEPRRQLFVTIAKVELLDIRLPNNFIAIPDGATHNRIGDIFQETLTQAELKFSISPTTLHVASLKAEFQYKKNGKKITLNLSSTTCLNQKETVDIKLGQTDFESVRNEQFDVTLLYTTKGVSSYKSNVKTVIAKRLLYEFDMSPRAYKDSFCPYSDVHSVPGGILKDRFWGLLCGYHLNADLKGHGEPDTPIKSIQGDADGLTITVAGKNLNVLYTMKRKDILFQNQVKWEGLNADVDEPAGAPFFDQGIYPYYGADFKYRSVVPNKVIDERNDQLKMTIKAVADPPKPNDDLKQEHDISNVPVKVKYNYR